ncbi:MAG: BatA and WFA domain-containing protein [Pirellulales bacterium]|nr:BatA and WFA domain-containing protein [Pirellulales bacterium]
MFPDLFRNTLTPLQWTLVALVPPAILALYFLKLKRQPLEVPSTYLWHKSIEDLHVNSLWQRLRKSLLLFLQLLIVFLAIGALLRPGWKSTALEGNRFILLIDNSASMSSIDVEGSRLARAKRLANDIIKKFERDTEAMLVTFAGRPRVVQEFTDNHSLLKQRLDTIQPTAESTELLEALQLADGLANPARIAIEEDGKEYEMTEPLPATVYILSDGRFRKVENFSLGNLQPRFLPIGTPAAENFAVTALSTRRHETRIEERQAFGRILNATGKEAVVTAELFLNGEFLDAKAIKLPAGESSPVLFPLENPQPGSLELRLALAGQRDDLNLDNIGYAAIEPATTGRVLVVSPGNPWLEYVFSTERIRQLATVEFSRPDVLGLEDYRKAVESGLYDLVIFDRCRPAAMPRANTVFFGTLPPSDAWQQMAIQRIEAPLILDWHRSHPVMANVELEAIRIWETAILPMPPGALSLIDAQDGPIAAIAPREQYQDIVLGFATTIDGAEGEGSNTTWPIQNSFPVFWMNTIEYLAGKSEETGVVVHRPGEAVEFAVPQAPEKLNVVAPDGKQWTVHRGKHNLYSFLETGTPGIYEARLANKVVRRIAVNLFDRQESEIRLTQRTTTQDGKEITEITPLEIGFVEVKGMPDWRPTRRELWPWLLCAALAVLGIEWYIYNRRIYL